MALQPQTIPAGSTNFLRFQGVMTLEATPGLPIGNAEIPTTAVGGAPVICRFAMGDTTNLQAWSRALVTPLSDNVSVSNLKVTVSAVLDGNLVNFDISPGAITVERDTLVSGLGQNTGLFVVCLPLTFTAIAPTTVDVIFQTIHSLVR